MTCVHRPRDLARPFVVGPQLDGQLPPPPIWRSYWRWWRLALRAGLAAARAWRGEALR